MSFRLPRDISLPNIDVESQHATQQALDQKTKPRGSLGRLESLAVQLAGIQANPIPRLTCPTLVVCAADHGIAAKGVSAFPSSVTRQMVLNFLSGGAAVNVLASIAGARVWVVDSGVAGDPIEWLASESDDGQKRLLSMRAGAGTRSFDEEPAITVQQLEHCWEAGRQLAESLHKGGCTVVGCGEMGIANTSSAAALIHLLLDLPLEACVGRGTGVNEDRFNHKLKTIKQAVAKHSISGLDEIVLHFGGFEIIQLASLMVHAALKRMVVVVDGFISTAAFLVAQACSPSLKDFCVFSHCSEEQGHQRVLAELGVTPLVSFGMRLGEGSGAALVLPIIRASLAVVDEMASFESASVDTETIHGKVA